MIDRSPKAFTFSVQYDSFVFNWLRFAKWDILVTILDSQGQKNMLNNFLQKNHSNIDVQINGQHHHDAFTTENHKKCVQGFQHPVINFRKSHKKSHSVNTGKIHIHSAFCKILETSAVNGCDVTGR